MPKWYYGSSAGQHGPVEEDELRAMIASGGVNPQTLVWREGMKDWLPLQAVRELGGQVAPHAPPYSQAPAYYPSGVANSGLAIASMVCGILCVLTFCIYGGIIGIPAVICGHMAINQIKNSPVPMAGRGMAVTGLITGYLGLLSLISMITFIVIVSMRAIHHSP